MSPKKPSAKPRQTKSTNTTRAKAIKSAEVVKTKEPTKPSMPAPQRPSPKRSLAPVFAGLVAIIALLLLAQYGKKMSLSTLPEMPSFTLPKMPDLSHLWSSSTQDETEQYIDVQPPVAQEIYTPDGDAQKLKQQLTEAEEKIQQLQAIVQEKDQLIQREITLRGQSLLAQYARLMERALEQGLPFPWELEQFQRFANENAIAEAIQLAQNLKPYAQGVSTDKKLREDFEMLSIEIYARWKKQESGIGVKAALSRMFQQIITIRPVGLVEGDTTDAILARARYFLEQKNLKEARDQLKTLDEEYALLTKPWLEQLALRMEVEKNMQALQEFAQKIVPAAQQTEQKPSELEKTIEEEVKIEADDLAVQPAEVPEP